MNHSSSSANSHKRLRSRSRSPSRSKHDDSRRKEHHHQSHSSSSSSRSKDVNSKSLSAEKEAERAKKCLPKIRDKHLTVCSSTLWLGHVPKTISEADISDAFGEYGTINSIDVGISREQGSSSLSLYTDWADVTNDIIQLIRSNNNRRDPLEPTTSPAHSTSRMRLCLHGPAPGC